MRALSKQVADVSSISAVLICFLLQTPELSACSANAISSLFTFRIAATSFDFCIVDAKHPPTGNRHIGLEGKIKHLMSTRTRNVKISYTVIGIEPCLLVREKAMVV